MSETSVDDVKHATRYLRRMYGKDYPYAMMIESLAAERDAAMAWAKEQHAAADRYAARARDIAPGVTVQDAARVLLDQPYSVMSAAFDAIEKLHGEGADRIMAAALRSIAGGGDD